MKSSINFILKLIKNTLIILFSIVEANLILQSMIMWWSFQTYCIGLVIDNSHEFHSHISEKNQIIINIKRALQNSCKKNIFTTIYSPFSTNQYYVDGVVMLLLAPGRRWKRRPVTSVPFPSVQKQTELNHTARWKCGLNIRRDLVLNFKFGPESLIEIHRSWNNCL